MSYVYIQSEPRLWTVGFYNPQGKFQSESDQDSEAEAAERVRLLNGGAGGVSELAIYITKLAEQVGALAEETLAISRRVGELEERTT